MALRIARGLFRLWLILSVARIIGVGMVTWRTFPDGLASYCDLPATQRSEEVDRSWLGRVKRDWSTILDPEAPSWAVGPEREAIRLAIHLALAPPAFVLALGSA